MFYIFCKHVARKLSSFDVCVMSVNQGLFFITNSLTTAVFNIWEDVWRDVLVFGETLLVNTDLKRAVNTGVSVEAPHSLPLGAVEL